MNKTPKYNILVLCTGNSARSIMAEACSIAKQGRISWPIVQAASRPG